MREGALRASGLGATGYVKIIRARARRQGGTRGMQAPLGYTYRAMYRSLAARALASLARRARGVRTHRARTVTARVGEGREEEGGRRDVGEVES